MIDPTEPSRRFRLVMRSLLLTLAVFVGALLGGLGNALSTFAKAKTPFSD